jgi:dimethylglycine dehydrogenase
MPADGSVQFQNLTGAIGVLVVAGPKARQLLERVSDADVSSAAFPWLTGQEIVVGMAPAKALRVNFVGELGWELHHGLEYQNHIFDALMEAGADLGLAPFGIRAMDSMRLEKSYRLIGTELSIEYAAYESGLDRFVHPDKGDFLGRDALLRWREHGFSNAFVTLEMPDVTDADPLGNNPIYDGGGKLVGRATGGNYGFRLEKSLALAMVRPEFSGLGTELEMDILGTRHRVTVIPESPYDPENLRLRS